MTATTLLRGISLFAQLREAELERIGQLAHIRDYPKNSVIVSGTSSGDTLYIIVAGKVKSMLIAEDGREVILSMLGAGEFFGEMALFDDDPSTTSVIAAEGSQLLLLRRDDLYRQVMEMPGVAIGLLRSLSRRLKEADHKIGGLILLDVPGRVSHLLLQLAAPHDGQRIPKPPTHQVMAQMVGSSRETVSRVLSDFSAHGIITTTRSEIVIENRAALEAATGHLRRLWAPRPTYDGQQERRRFV
ncbi:MAG: Crp/Fnr family transcriptional regulator [Gemmatimonadaceae bacterium]